jgi:membrane protease YdiL (CAAX protease family)
MQTSSRPLESRSIVLAAAVVLALAWSMISGDVLSAIGMPSLFPYSRALVATLSDFAVMLLLVGLAAAISPVRLLQLSGVLASPAKPLLWAALVFAPALVAAILLGTVAGDVSGPDLVWKGVAAPLFEELLYRGLAVGALMRLAGWGLLPACLLPAIFFGAIHAYQGGTPQEIAGAVAITGIGGLYFGWLLWRWHWNLWPAVLVHMGLNLIWMVFALGESAVGGWLGNALRAAVILLSILLTIRMVPKPGKTA